ncbi:hypothetical protein [Pandoraea sputorum]|uniref:Uncharacterized protein n=1 Tax=Pandoraea sputorum TaxID=93222 RepID=A0A5E5BI64_9BURK|nr:hypothetical protein [Pandoraea sputorum]VVE85911.1 hypothetical protein PSP31121_05544 [Pandoraea sputorum]
MSLLDGLSPVSIARPDMRYGPEQSDDQIDVLLKTVDFSKPETVKNAYEAISKMSIMTFLLDLIFYGGDHADGLKAFAHLALQRCAETAGADPSEIPGKRDMALRTLRGGLTWHGQDALAKTLDNTRVADNSFAKYFTLDDRRAMAADALLTAAKKSMEEGAYSQAAETYLRAHTAYTLLNLPRMATDARRSAAEASVKAGLHREAGHLYLLVHQAYQFLNLPREATDARLAAAEALLSVQPSDAVDAPAHHAAGKAAALGAADDYARQGLYEPAAAANLKVARLSPEKTAPEFFRKSAICFLLARDVYTKQKLLQRAADAGKSAVQAFVSAKSYPDAEIAAAKAAETYDLLALHPQAEEVRLMAQRVV